MRRGREGGYCWKKDLVTPAKIQNVVSKTKDHTTNGQEGIDELSKLHVEAGEREREKTYIWQCA